MTCLHTHQKAHVAYYYFNCRKEAEGLLKVTGRYVVTSRQGAT